MDLMYGKANRKLRKLPPSKTLRSSTRPLKNISIITDTRLGAIKPGILSINNSQVEAQQGG